MIKKENNYILVEAEDLILAMQKAKKEKSIISTDLQDLFISSNKMTDEGLYKVRSNSSISKYLKNVDGIVFEEEFITLDIIATSLARAIYEYNHEMEKSIKKYFRLLVDAKINKEDDQLVINLILADQKVIDYIKKFDSLDDYIKETIKKRIDKSKTAKKEIKETTKNRSYVIM